MIDRAAIRNPDGRIWTVPRPGRHPDIIRMYCRETGAVRIPSGHTQGFVTDRGAFLDRAAALTHARNANQLRKPPQLGDLLISEDLW